MQKKNAYKKKYIQKNYCRQKGVRTQANRVAVSIETMFIVS
jgi:hypothetical protein